MNLSKTTFGPFELYSIETGDFKLDGGAMFGVVPKTLWAKGIKADEHNRIPMTMRCLLIKSTQTGRIYLVDNGAGTKFNEKMTDIYKLDYSTKNLEDSLSRQGFTMGDVTDVIFTHLHFDHCGGTTYYDENQNLAFTFPDAQYHVTKSHWETAINPNARERASFLAENIDPLKENSKLNLVDENHEYEPGLTTLIMNGHTIGQQLPVLTHGDKTLVFVADLLPTHVHVPLPWVMGYDMYPVQTLQEKERFLKDAAENSWYIFLEHDAEKEIIQIEQEGRRFFVSRSMTLDDV